MAERKRENCEICRLAARKLIRHTTDYCSFLEVLTRSDRARTARKENERKKVDKKKEAVLNYEKLF